jgi:phage-related protein
MVPMPIQRLPKVSEPGDPMEQEADSVATKVTSGQPAGLIGSTTGAPPATDDGLASRHGLFRQEDDDTVQSLLQRQADEEDVQRQEDEDVQTLLQRQAEDDDVQLQPVNEEEGSVQRQDEDEQVQLQPANEDEASIQRQGDEEDVQLQTDDEPQTQLLRQAADEEVAQPLLQRQTDAGDDTVQGLLQRQADAEPPRQADGETVQSLASPLAGPPPITPTTASTIRNPGAGAPVPATVKRTIEPHLGASMSGVEVHTGQESHQAAGSLRARAFTHGSHIFLNRGESPYDVPLMAHEAAHVVQQGAAIQRQAGDDEVQLLPDFIMDRVAGYARHIPGYTLFTVIIGFNPLNGARVERNAMNLVEGLMGLVPFGTAIFDKLRELGILQDAFDFIERQLASFDLSLERIERTIDAAWDDMDFIRLDPFDYNVGVLTRHFGALVDDVRSFAGSVVDRIIELIKEAVVGVAEGLLADNAAWDLIKKILHFDPLRGEPVDAPTVEILEDFLMLIGKEQELEQMRVRGTLQETADWLDTQFATFMGLLTELGSLFSAAWEAIQPENLPNLMANLESLAGRVVGFLQRVWDFATTVAVKVLELIKNALLGWLASVADEVPGFHLITVILGRNPFTQEEVPPTAANLIRGFISLLPGGNQMYENLAETGVIGEAAARIEGAIADLGISWEFITGIFLGIWDSLSIDDLIDPIGAFQRIVGRFGEPISRLFRFIRVVLEEVIKLILALMNFPTEILASIISNALAAFEDITRDPIAFIKNMLAAVKLGFSNFFGNILDHLLAGLVDWLFRGLRDAGIEPPTEITLESVLDLVMQVLGITEDRLWEKLAERIGQERVDQIRGAIDSLVGIWNFIRDVQDRGVAAVWEYIESQISSLWSTVLQMATTWIMEKIITQVTVKLLSMLDPTGIMAVVNSFIAFFNAVQSAIEYIRDILEIVNDYVTTIAAVARGDIEPGAAKMEQGLANAIPIAIGFLANQVGLGNIAEKIAEIIEGIRAVVDQALDWLMDQAIRLGEGLLRTLGIGGAEEGEETPESGDEDVDASDHSAVLRRVIEQLEGAATAEGYEAVRTAVEARAREAEAYWSSRLESGIGLTITFTPTEVDTADNDIDFRVVIAPNNAEGTGSVGTATPTGGGSFVGKQADDPKVQEDLVTAGYVRPYQHASGTWVIRVPAGNPNNLTRLSTDNDNVTIVVATERPEPSPAGEIYFDLNSFVATQPRHPRLELFKSGAFDGEYRLQRSRYRSGLPRYRPRQGEARDEIESLMSGRPTRERRDPIEESADELLRRHGMQHEPSESERILDEAFGLEETDEGLLRPVATERPTFNNSTGMSSVLVNDFLDAYFANGGWPPGWQVDHVHEVRFGGFDIIGNYAPLPPDAHSAKTTWWNNLARAVLADPEIRAAFEDQDTAEARELNP